MSSTPLFTTPPPPPPPSINRNTLSANVANFPPSPDKLAILLDKPNSINQLLQIHATLLRHGLDQHPILNFKLQRSYSSLGRLDYSLALFNRTRNPNIFVYTSIINAHSLQGLSEEALLIYIRMLFEGVQPNEFTFSSILKSCSIQLGKMLHSQVIKLGFDSDLYVKTGLVDVYARGGDIGSARLVFERMLERSLVSLTTMLTCYAKHGELDEARLLFDGMVKKDVVCWNVMIDGYAQHGRPNEALVLFRRMLATKARPDEITLLAVSSACGQLGALESGRWLHSFIKNNNIQVTVRVATALIDMYSKCGSLEDARLVFDSIHDKDVVAWNSMIIGYTLHGFSRDALDLFHEMCRTGLRPTDITFIGVLGACGHAGLVSEGRSLFNAMENEYGIEPKVEHYGCMVNLLGRAGQLEEAYDLVKNMKRESDPILWGALLGACRLHDNLELGEKIAEFLVSRNIANSGTYILLSNMYAAKGKWEEVARIRTLMKESGVTKEPGCSSIEVQNKVHEFLAGDLKHPKTKEIYMMLEEMNGWVKAHGYTPQTEIVLHDIEDWQKEQSLEVHSEKLALAYGLISTKPGTPIKIVKNLRVCPDCHAVIKLISKITGRKIVMRDRNRFHHFVNGSCSCGDYW
ncbi:hypothetical protein COLO4_11506 [Corchorus olitorius]|uniref:DYW domain-containing protein n=1 Tax=Corchorus olitorius TaxID=93759 RepID=A0A1R3K449_9ROSI|nr:hypothetical protein COLO4_11506 [Corchorus olitorius]